MLKKFKNGIALMLLMIFCLMVLVPVAQAGTIVAQPGDQNATVTEINKMLKALGYYYGSVNDTYGVSTKSAVSIFQRANGLSATGVVDEQTYNALKAAYGGGSNLPAPDPEPSPQPDPQPNPQPDPEPSPQPDPTPVPEPNPETGIVAKPGDYNDTVGEINMMLKTLGYYFGGASNFYTTSTKYAVMRFQSANGINATGIVDTQTYNLLKTKYQGGNIPAPEPEPQPNPQPDPNPAPNPVPTPGLTAEEQQMVDMVNTERQKAGLAPLQVDMRLVQSARVKSQDMITNNYFSHTSPVYGGFAALIRKYAPNYIYVGENIAGNTTVTRAQDAFMNSTGHRKNILNPNYTHIGIGIVSGGPYGKMFTQHFGGN